MTDQELSPPVEVQIRHRQSWKRRLWFFVAPILARLTLAVLGAIAAMFVFVTIAHEVNKGATRQLDTSVLHYFHSHYNPSFHTAMFAVSWIAGAVPQSVLVIICAIGFALARRFLPDGVTILFGYFGGLVLIVSIKALFHRPRPEVIFEHLGYSFPSGHSFCAVMVYGMLAYWLARDMPPFKRRIIWSLAIGAILLVGFSRVALGEHYPSDVIAGFAVALPWLWGSLALPTAFHKRGVDISPEEKIAQFEAGRDRLKEAALFLPNLIKLTSRLARDARVPRSRKIGLMLLTGYLALPFDLIPDFIPVLGVADDIILASLVLGWVLKAVPREVISEHWDGRTDLFSLLDTARDGINKILGHEPIAPATPTNEPEA
jgi:membrane-associated phospholipid phosphatase/uncharacterized membrane protein YkvA (DUF1232 family)